MFQIRAIPKTGFLLFLTALMAGCNPAESNQVAQASESVSAPIECLPLMFATREDMIPPYVAITIDADDNFAVGATRPTEDSYVVDVEYISSGESERLREELASATDGQSARIFIHADANSRTQSFISALLALTALELYDVSIVVKEK